MPKDTRFILTQMGGRLGNQLSVHSYLMAHCIEYSGQMINCAFMPYSTYFEGTKSDQLCRFPAPSHAIQSPKIARAVSLILRGVNKFDRHVTHRIGRVQKGDMSAPENAQILAQHCYVSPGSWWISDAAALFKHAAEIRLFFQPIASIRAQVDNHLETLKARGDLAIGVHIRRGDYKHMVPLFFYDYDVYLRYMRDAQKLFSDRKVVFFICSDEPIPEQLFSEFDCLHVPQGPIEDMYTLAGCDYIIGTKSSFNSWASFYGDTPTYWILGQDRPLVKEEFLRLPPGFIPQHSKRAMDGASHPYFA